MNEQRYRLAELPNAGLEILPRAGHLPWLDDPEHAAGVVRRFLGAHDMLPASA